MNKIIEKYEGKTIKIENKVYVIGIAEGNNEIDTEVWLHPKYGGSDAWSYVSYDDYEYQNGGHIYKAAVDKAKEILGELEAGEETDF
jgi:hypothetical protein